MKRLHDGTEVTDSTPTKLVDGKRYALGENEIAQREAEVEDWHNSPALQKWEEDIAAFDQWMPRPLEDLIDSNPGLVLTGFQKGKYNEKKALRAERPDV